MQLGAFSISLTVKNIAASKAFYEALGFSVFEGDQDQGWLIMKNSSTVIGLFQGMFDKNMLTFNPGWDNNAQPLETFTDVRDLKASLKAQGIDVESEAETGPTGPASFTVIDPDGNPIFFDQHV